LRKTYKKLELKKNNNNYSIWVSTLTVKFCGFGEFYFKRRDQFTISYFDNIDNGSLKKYNFFIDMLLWF
jgi:hypothetical protein